MRRNFAFDEPVFDSETIKPYGGYWERFYSILERGRGELRDADSWVRSGEPGRIRQTVRAGATLQIHLHFTLLPPRVSSDLTAVTEIQQVKYFGKK